MMRNAQKGPYRICKQRRSRSASAVAHADQGLRCPLTESMGTVEYVGDQRKPRSGCTDAHADLDLCCTHIE